MTDEFKIIRAERTQARLRLALTATSNGGKTWSSILLAKGIVEHLLAEGVVSGTLEGKIGMIDTERKSGALYAHLCPFDCIALNPPYTAERYAKALSVLEAAGYVVIIVDQISHAWSGPGGMLALLNKKAKAEHYGNTFNAWADVTPEQDAFIDRLLCSPAHLIITMRQKTEWVLQERANKKGEMKMTPTRIGMKPIQRDGVEYDFTTLLTLDTETHLAKPLKNRCPVFQDGVQVLLNEEVGHKLAEWMLGGAPLAAEERSDPSAQDRVVALTLAAEDYLPQCENIADLARRFADTQQQLRKLSAEATPEFTGPYLARVVAAKDARKATLTAAGSMVQDLAPGELELAGAQKPSAIDMARASCEKIGNARGGLFSDVKDDLPWED
jgi:hypothetical protein